ncbi:MAG: hypothetical protein OSJ61_27740 [Lachnospiraceae bacterium]|nr:hypothetical protein [Lachnospiraceae bacterium]
MELIQTESIKVESVVRRGQQSQNWIGCDTMTQLLPFTPPRYTVFHRIP